MVHKLDDVDSATDEILEQVVEITDSWYQDGNIDWENVWDRLENYRLSSGATIEIDELDNPAIRKIKRHVRNLRAQG